jgi:predicted TIM-barrel fold metal-dependent hydrolase
MDRMIIDCHCHVFPDHIAKVVLGRRPSGLNPVHDGTIDGLIKTLDESGIDMALTLGVANKAANVARTNEFIGSVPRDRFVPFGTVHPELSNEENLRHLSDNGIRGVKLHPLFQTLSLGDPRVVDLVAALADAGVVLVTHAGAGGDAEANERGAPAHIAKLLDKVPNAKLITCHYGGYHRLDEAERLVVGSRAVLETSWPPTLAELDPDKVVPLIRRHGADRVVFGSDWPMADPGAEVAAIRKLGLTKQEEDGILGDNLARLLGLS